MSEKQAHEKCQVTGKLIFPNKQAARGAIHDLGKSRAAWHVQFCVFGEHYHLSSSRGPRRGKKDAQKVTRGKR